MPNITINVPSEGMSVGVNFPASGIARSNDTQVSGVLVKYDNNGNIVQMFPNQPIVVPTVPPNSTFTINFQAVPIGTWVVLIVGVQSNASSAVTVNVQPT